MKKLLLVSVDCSTEKIKTILNNPESSLAQIFTRETKVQIVIAKKDGSTPFSGVARSIISFLKKKTKATILGGRRKFFQCCAFVPRPGTFQNNEGAYNWVCHDLHEDRVVIVITENSRIDNFVKYLVGMENKMLSYGPQEEVFLYDLGEKTKVDIFSPKKIEAAVL